MPEPTTTRRRRTTQKSELDAAARFVEELSWLLTAHSELDFRMLQKLKPPSEHLGAPDSFGPTFCSAQPQYRLPCRNSARDD